MKTVDMSIEECTTSIRCESCKNKAICSHTTKTVIEYNEKLKLDAAKIDTEIKEMNEKAAFGDEDIHHLNDLCVNAAEIAWKLSHPWKAETCECGGRFVCDDDQWASRKRCDGIGCMDSDDLSADAHIHYETVCNGDCQMFRWGECAGDGKFIKHRFDDNPVCEAGLLKIEATQDHPDTIYPDMKPDKENGNCPHCGEGNPLTMVNAHKHWCDKCHELFTPTTVPEDKF